MSSSRWTTFAVDRTTRNWAVAQGSTQKVTAVEAHEDLRARMDEMEGPDRTWRSHGGHVRSGRCRTGSGSR